MFVPDSAAGPVNGPANPIEKTLLAAPSNGGMGPPLTKGTISKESTTAAATLLPRAIPSTSGTCMRLSQVPLGTFHDAVGNPALRPHPPAAQAGLRTSPTQEGRLRVIETVFLLVHDD